MVLNNCRYGVLSSGSRTYFLHISPTRRDREQVLVADAGFIGQRNYLRAWAYFSHLACHDDELEISPRRLRSSWYDGTPEKRKDPDKDSKGSNKRRRDSGPSNPSATGSSGGNYGTGTVHASCIPSINYDDIVFGEPIGYGRNGSTYSATWNGETVAVKIFDLTKGSGWKDSLKEIQAYESLKGAWGVLIPTPKFLARACGCVFLGLQMAERPAPNTSSKQWDGVLRKLEEEYGFRHLDVDSYDRMGKFHNRMVLRDHDGHTRPIIIDLEQYEWLVK
jgi:hypothetical protein